MTEAEHSDMLVTMRRTDRALWYAAVLLSVALVANVLATML